MPYIFPKRRLRDQDVLDADEMNEDFIPATDLYSGNLDEHNFKSGLNPTISTDVVASSVGIATPILSNAHWNIYFASKSSNPAWGTVGSYTNPYNTENTAPVPAQNAFIVQNTSGWQPVDDVKFTLQTSNSKLWIVACLQYIWEGFNELGGHKYSYPSTWTWLGGSFPGPGGGWAKYPCMIQFALRVDGQVIEVTKTGLDTPHDKVVRPYQTMQERNTVGDPGTSYVTPGPGSDGDPNCGGLSPEVGMVRLGYEVPVSAGTHIVDVVVRRLPVYPIEFNALEEDLISYSSGNRVSVFNRQILVTESPLLATSTAKEVDISTPAYDAEDVISGASLGAERVDVVRDRFNDIEDGALARGALNNQQLSSKITFASQATITPTTRQSFLTFYPGFAVPFFTTGRTSATPAFYGPLEDSVSGDRLRVDGPAVAINTETVILLLANVETRRLNKYDTTTSSPIFKSSSNEFCVYCLASKTLAGSRTQDGLSEAACNRDTNMAVSLNTAPGLDQGNLDPIARDIPLMRVIKVGGSSVDSNGNSFELANHVALGNTFENFSVHGATMAPQELDAGGAVDCPATGAGANVVAEYVRANLSAIFFRKE